MLTADTIYRQLQNLKFKKKTRFINFTVKDQTLDIVQYNHDVDYRTKLRWEDITCAEYILPSGLQIKSTCKLTNVDVARSSKVFVNGFTNFFEYVKSIQQGYVTYDQHIELFDILLTQAKLFSGYKLVNHNLDVNILHFKYVNDFTPDDSTMRLENALLGHSRAKGGLNKPELLEIAQKRGLAYSARHTRASLVALFNSKN